MSKPKNVDGQRSNSGNYPDDCFLRLVTMIIGTSAKTNVEAVSGGAVEGLPALPAGVRQRSTADLYFVPELMNLVGLSYAMRSQIKLKVLKELLLQSECLEKMIHMQIQLLGTTNSGHVVLPYIFGYILPPVTLRFRRGECDGGSQANWNGKIERYHMFSCVSIKCWVVLTTNKHLEITKVFVVDFMETAHAIGLHLPAVPNIIPIDGKNAYSYLHALDKIVNEIDPPIIIVIMEKFDFDVYASIKRKLCIDLGVVSKMVSLKTLKTEKASPLVKLAVQLNTKLGGMPWMVQIPTKGIIIVCISTYRETSDNNTAYGTLIASLDDTYTRYYNFIESYDNVNNMTNCFADNLIIAALRYKKQNGTLPASFLIYRAGLKDGQIPNTYILELKTIKARLTDFYDGKEPPMAFVLVQRRPNSKLFTYCSENEVIDNVLPGTVVDFNNDIDTTTYDFLMVSRNATLGIEMPTYYVVIQDTLKNWSRDKMISLTYKLTHMYFNRLCSCSTPAPCELANKLGWFTSETLKGIRHPKLDESLFYL
ncbi:Piwi domain,Ribonuclease H-like domain [Cinara cedri]|uniref:Piwi domain,Ribonuclease H-like domain n=1 Tax=Cinara cedri TaxID=506608 RepID=A0A5E4MII2_9HEMI|nr:Piwi domain,Ribonuclease H-like domain [Cinara cedri]